MTEAIAPAMPGARSAVKIAATIVLGVALITLCAKLRVPSWPVPMTLHTLAVMALAVTVGPRLAAATFCAYLAVGAAGLPVFSGTPERGIGLAYMVGPTGGYLLGYLSASWITGTLARDRGPVGRALAMLAGLAVVYAAGLSWLALYVPANQIVALGFVPFILGDLTNIAIVAVGGALLPARLRGKIVR
ncbi:biotin transporter BioY [Reyranella sp.]|jgi:biotin transport system substrate-specific component|uniref:biotin transporter BioY n=1 Tax=Reyranella sp. TaxID=1929291 RepID=UPI000BC6E972|nr:biotin transporter BioY [Reyranella sp.]OYY34635.1 MAG: BioY family transporter [Rhodospirillales bacterium 35-66-84]OYZ91064.1 MAG: BioY family transporter [Rhodospirillales bacterium 24-66-33]OZB21556.1 MAG: BioY family transporter [Rhodospirillales bacterium 39-66-50]HQS19116.1 biotin transporter BioY [Reyranella sp.]HQT15320.1 biotin transporter BioY [Reyranella sp.]